MRTIALLLALAVAACAASPPHVAHFEPADRAAIQAVIERQVAAWNHGDLARYMDGYARTPALIFTSGGNVRRGWQEAFDFYQARYATDPAAMGTLAFAI